MSFTISPGRLGSTEIRIVKGTTLLTDTDIKIFTETEALKKDGAIWLFIHEADLKYFLDFTKSNNYKFHHVENSYYVYYKWNNPTMEDKVPSFATSISGAAVLPLSPDMSKILLVFEYGKFKCVTGAVDYRETIFDTAKRELKEETNLDIDSSFTPLLCGGWNISNVKPSVGINDVMFCYIIRVLTLDNLKLDTSEIDEAEWFDIEFLKKAYTYMLSTTKLQDSKAPNSEFIEYEKKKISCTALLWINNYLIGRTFNNNIFQNNKNVNLIY